MILAEIAEVYPSKLICGILYHESIDLPSVSQRLESLWGEIDFESSLYEFSSGSSYYEKEMGSPVYRKFVSFKKLVRPDNLAEHKLQTQKLEEEWGCERFPNRPLNLDPGHITRGRMILATTKDFSHRIYLHSGIYAEVTLLLKKNKVESLPWTYPDIAQGHYDDFMITAKDSYQTNLTPLKTL